MWSISYFVEGVIIGIEEGWADMMAGVPAGLANLLMLAAGCDASIPWSAPHWCHLAMYIGANC